MPGSSLAAEREQQAETEQAERGRSTGKNNETRLEPSPSSPLEGSRLPADDLAQRSARLD